MRTCLTLQVHSIIRVPSKNQKNNQKGRKNPKVNIRQLVDITERLARVALAPKKSTRSRRTNMGNATSSALFTVGENLFHHSPACQRLTGLAASVAAQFAPFDIPRGVVGVLSDAKPSQKFSARGFTTVSLAANEKMVGYACPNIYSDNTYASMFINIGAFAAVNSCGPLSGGAAVAGVSSRVLTTNTPYSSATLTAARAEFRLVSHGIRIKCTSNAMNRGGSLFYIVDTNETQLAAGDTGNTNLTLEDRMLASSKCVRVSLASQPVVDITVPHRTIDSPIDAADGWVDTTDDGYYDQIASVSLSSSGLPLIRGAFGQVMFSYQNGSGVAQNFDIEQIEHWEVIFSGAEQVATPSTSHPGAAEIVRNIVHQAHQTHANHPTLSLKSVIKQVSNMAHNKEVTRSIPGILTAIAAL